MKKVTRIMQVKQSDGTSEEVHLGCHADDVILDNGNDLETEINTIYNTIDESSGGIAPNNVSDLAIAARNEQLTITWSDPEDSYIDGVLISSWAGTKLVMKLGSYPTSTTDGTLIIDNKVRNQYQTTGYTITGLTNDTTYYFALFPYATTGAVNINSANQISGVPVTIAPDDVTNMKIKVGNTKLTLSWTDPDEDIYSGDEVVNTWAGTKVLYKIGSYPTSPTDGTLVIDNQVHNQYASTGIEITGLTNETTYYFQLFPYNNDGAYNTNETNRITGTPQPYRVMTAVIDESDSNPATCVTYADDAEGMEAGSSDWDDFFGYRPCLMTDGVVTKYLNPDNFNYDVDGNAVSLTGSDGDVMIEFPRHGLNISKSGTQITVSMTDETENTDYGYYAHTNGSTSLDNFYLGAYLGYNDSSKIYSRSGVTPTASVSLTNFVSYANARGDGYSVMGAFQVYYLQAMYILKYANLNSQSTIGQGIVSGSVTATGGSETWGMDMENATSTVKTSKTDHSKLFGLEDLWGNLYQRLTGLYSNSSYQLCLTTDGSIPTSSSYEYIVDTGISANTYGYMTKTQGSNLGGFALAASGGSNSTYYCDYGYFYAGFCASFGGDYSDDSLAGVFSFRVSDSTSGAYAYFGCRLMYLG